jgi:Cation transporter/ATPase, N-terminus
MSSALSDRRRTTTTSTSPATAVSADLRLFTNVPEEANHHHQTTSKNSNVLKKVSQMGMTLGDDDLRYAEEIAAHGTRRERRTARSQEGGRVPPLPPSMNEESDGFVFNDIGLTTDEAQRRLDVYGFNALPEKVDPQWLLLVRILTQPMVRTCLVGFVGFVLFGGFSYLALVFVNTYIPSSPTNSMVRYSPL